MAERLLQLGTENEVHRGDPLQLIERWTRADDVIIVDAVMTGAAVGTVHLWDGGRAAIPCRLPVSTHGFSIADAVELARVLGRFPQRLRVYGIEGRQFGVGRRVSPEVKPAVEKVAQTIAVEV